MDEIKLTGLKIFAHHGVLESEKENGQDFLVDITIRFDTMEAGLSDDLSKTVNYAEMAEYAIKIFAEKSYDLIERAAEVLAGAILKKYDIIREIFVTVHKPFAPINAEFTDVSLSVSRRWHRAFVAVGSNLGDSKAIIEAGKAFLMAREDIRIVNEATLIKTKPYGVTDQPDFVNGMWEILTLLTPERLLEVLHEAEKSQKRERKIHWGPRTLDLDIIYYDKLIMNTDDLIIPHADMCNRSFVLEPLCELAPNYRHPVNGLTTTELLDKLNA